MSRTNVEGKGLPGREMVVREDLSIHIPEYAGVEGNPELA
jgi:hypothetical protein